MKKMYLVLSGAILVIAITVCSINVYIANTNSKSVSSLYLKNNEVLADECSGGGNSSGSGSTNCYWMGSTCKCGCNSSIKTCVSTTTTTGGCCTCGAVEACCTPPPQ